MDVMDVVEDVRVPLRWAGGRPAPRAFPLSDVQLVPVAAVLSADSPRQEAENLEHALTLAESAAELPPIVVHRPTMRVIDGTHRLRVARLRGRGEIEARFFDGPEEDAFVLAVQTNIGHGLPLSLAERTAAAARIIVSHPQWSDRAIAQVTGISHKTVAVQRRKIGGEAVQPLSRIGCDGKERPVSSAEGRRLASRLIAAHPQASLRDIAARAGISAGTVRDVRARLGRGEDPVPQRRGGGSRKASEQAVSEESQALPPGPEGPETRGVRRAAAADTGARERESTFRSLCRDPSLRQTNSGRLLLRMLEMHVTQTQRWDRVAEAVPAHRAAAIAEMAAECARQWQALAARASASAKTPERLSAAG
nr:SauR [Streptomyces sp.]